MFRKIGWLKETTRRTFPTDFIFWDTESDIIERNNKIIDLPFKLGVAIYIRFRKDYSIQIREILPFTAIVEFTDFILSKLSKSRTLHIVAHNIAHDIMTINGVHLLNSLGFTSSPPIINNRLFIWRASHPLGKTIWFDTANYSITSVAALGKDLGFTKLLIDLKNATDKELFIYCQRDVEIIERFITNYLHFIKDNNLGSFCYSLASQALSAWRYRFMEQSIFIHNHPELLQLERDAYHGGRVECFYLGYKVNEMHWNLDINSMYPHIMRNYLLPYRPTGYNKNPSLAYLKQQMRNNYVIARVELNTKLNAFPLIMDSRLLFPIGHYITTLHHAELEVAIKEGSILKVLEMGAYLQAYLFRDYVDFFYRIKQNADNKADETTRLMAKLFLNSLYGKFAQHNVIRRKLEQKFPDIIFRAGGYNAVQDYTFQEFIWFGVGYVEQKQGETSHSSPALAGAITASARILLYQYINQAGIRNCLYCDTDSLFVNANGFDNLTVHIANGELGKLKIEKQSTRLRIYAPKDYIFGNKKRHKGIPSKATRIDVNVWLVEQWLGIKTWISDGAKDTPYIVKRRKEAKHVYNKGIVADSGYVLPFTLSV